VLHKLQSANGLPAYFLICMLINAVVFFKSIPVFFIPDALLLAYLVYKFKDLNQDVSPLFFAGVLLFFGYYLFSPEPTDMEYQNKFIVTLKPFIYICILALYSRNAPMKSLHGFIKGVVVFYPFLLVWNIAMYYIKHRPPLSRLVQESRPYFIFENNFEITFYITCFIALVFIYKDKSLKNYFYLCLVILLANSRSGLLSFVAISPFYFWSLEAKKRWIALGVAAIAAGFVGVSRSITQIAGNVDRLQTLNLMWSTYDKSFAELLSHPFGHGIYAKLPTYLCIKLPDFAEWFVGNSNNCDPIMLQAFYTRGLFQFGFYVTLLIPIMFFLLVRRETGTKLAMLIVAPMACVATSVGGFSNGLAFLGVLLCVYAYVQVHHQNEKPLHH
jgi:hypothetical protein